MKYRNSPYNSSLAIICFFMLFSVLTYSQNFKKEKHIYLLDITKSMWGLNGATPDIFDLVKDKLFEGIGGITNPETVITIIPFQGTTTYEDHNLPIWTFTISDKAKIIEMKKVINSYNLNTVPGSNTDVYSAIVKGQNAIDPERSNYIYLLTDGKQSKKGGSVHYNYSDLTQKLLSWCSWAKPKDVNLFYVMLTEASKGKEILNIIEMQCNAQVTNGTNFNFAVLSPINTDIMVNLHDKPSSITINLSANDWSYLPKQETLRVKLNENNIFQLKEEVVKIIDQKLILNLNTVNNLNFNKLSESTPQETTIPLQIFSNSEEVKIINPSLNIVVKNKKERTLKLEFKNE